MAEQKAWRCSVCGYVHRGDEPPEYCPVCGASAAEFEAYEEPSAPAAQPKAKRWRCLNCSYIHEGDSPPDMCPVCGLGPDDFEPILKAEPEEDASSDAIRAVIVGAGIAGVTAAEAIREASSDSTITLISHENRTPYYRLNLIRFLSGEIDATSLEIHPQEWYREKNIDLLVGEEITELSTEKKEVHLCDGKSVTYDKLILAMGSHPFIPPIAGTDLAGVFTLRTATDAEAILKWIDEGVPCVCIGGGVLGLETAGALAQRGGDVTLLESHEWLMPRQLNAEAAALLESHMANIGVKIRKEARTQQILGQDGQVSGVLLKDGKEVPCGIVVICTGVRPNTHLARKIDLEVNRGVVVNNHLVTSDPHILAAGDLSEHNGIVYGVWGPSQFQGTIAGLNALGIDTPFGGLPRSNGLKVLGVEMLSIGQFTPEDGSYEVIQEQEGSVLRHFVFHDGKMVGAILFGNTTGTARVKKAIEGQIDFSGVIAEGADCSAILTHI